ncbi:unnamed protein product [Brugia timori]|uniref:N-acetyltransferase domain-containing protein n=1 Tax=Brugia timori TaxID=42155 RepID=A0A3P7W5Z9_9BILA|nr:unnamed protein product [Brugia timori]
MEFDNYAFVSLYYVRPEYRKKGVGEELFKRVVNDNLRRKNIGLNAVDDIQLTIKDGKEVSLQRIIDYDAKVAKCQREDFIRHWAVDRIDAVCKV